MPPSWLLSPSTLFSRTPSTTSIPPYLSPSLSLDRRSSTPSDDLLTPFEQEFGRPDIPGGWFDDVALRQKLVDAVKDGQASLSNGNEVEKAGVSWDRDIRVTKLVVHPIKSCRGIELQTSVLTPQGLEFDRQWAIRNSTTGQIVTARELPRMVLIDTAINEQANELRISFPIENELEGFSVSLRTGLEEMGSWEKIESNVLFGKPLPPVLLVPALDRPTLSPSAQLSEFLELDVQLVRVSPFMADRRVCSVPDGVGEGVMWAEEMDRLGPKGEVTTGFADGYPLLIANEESYRSVVSAITDSAADKPSSLTDLGPTFDKARWQRRSFDYRRFRANIVVGSSLDLPVEMRGPSSTETTTSRSPADPTRPASAWEEDSWRELEFTDNDGTSLRKGGLICTSRCGRCQLPNVCPETAEQDKAVPFKVISKYRRVDPAQKYTPIFGVNAMSTDLSGNVKICVGDRVRVVARNRWTSLPVSSRDKGKAI